jgi:hypothetical protein
MHNSSVYSLLAVLAVSLALPASAQDRDVPPGGLARNDAECQAQFNRLDDNADGILSRGEIRAGRDLIPPRLASDEKVISRQEFLSACSEGTRSLEPGG